VYQPAVETRLFSIHAVHVVDFMPIPDEFPLSGWYGDVVDEMLGAGRIR
jgi:hypothetical protein